MVKGVVIDLIIEQDACQNKRSPEIPKIRQWVRIQLQVGKDRHCERSEAISGVYSDCQN